MLFHRNYTILKAKVQPARSSDGRKGSSRSSPRPDETPIAPIIQELSDDCASRPRSGRAIAMINSIPNSQFNHFFSG
jgi:hypothetical protein